MGGQACSKPDSQIGLAPKTEFSTLSNEIIYYIFQFLDNKHILVCRRVCPVWKIIIDALLELPLEVTGENYLKLFGRKENKFTVKRIHSLTIKYIVAFPDPKICLHWPFDPNILKCVTFSTSQINPQNFLCVLQNCPRIQTLTIEYPSGGPGAKDWKKVREITHSGIRNLNFFNLKLMRIKQVIKLLGLLNLPNLVRLSVLGKSQQPHYLDDIQVFRDNLATFIRRHLRSLAQINAFMEDDEYNRNIIQSPVQLHPKNLSVRILNTCAFSWRDFLKELPNVSELELSLSDVQNFESLHQMLEKCQATLKSLDVACENMGNVNLNYFKNFKNMMTLCLKCYNPSVITNINALPAQLEVLHICLFPLTKENWDHLLQLGNLTGLEIGVPSDTTPAITFDESHYQKLQNHPKFNEVYIHGTGYVAKWKELDNSQIQKNQIEETNITDESVHLVYCEEDEFYDAET